MKVDIEKLFDCLLKLESSYSTKLGPTLNKNEEFNAGFIYAVRYIRNAVVPAIEEEEQMEKFNALLALYAELEALRLMLERLEAEQKKLKKDGDTDPGL